MKKLVLLLVLVMVATFVLVGCGGSTASDQPSDGNNVSLEDKNGKNSVDFSKLVQVRGSDTMVNLGQQWAEVFMDNYLEAQIAVTGGGSGTGIAALINGTVDIAQASRQIRDAEIQQGKDNGIDIVEHVTGRDGIAIIVNNDNPVQELTLADLKAIYTGEKSNWKDFGGNDGNITLYSRESNSGTYAFFKEFVLEDEEYATHSNLMPSTQAIVEGVMQDVNGIGYIGLGYLSNAVEAVAVSADGNSEAILPSISTVQSGDYPVARPLFLYTAGEPKGVVELYMNFIIGNEGQKIVEDTGFIPIN
ncbi:phosphate ABC transporter substrate-binding protein, PhoT family [Natronincola peptidivorans]|uniref:Phosphate-binding protein n=1 Tax=Natronincola peptidivorans TaxID=426128 RepID=A0A1I0F1T5_9FIRM|nr:PstS family phosphate ABC transporter substrate-binding protein [Natronincola peptidivorans]SET51835.1 phosphate ABC transporter substrate-binding protein, PhoT family [Natronincola peptidivorans]